MSEAQRHASGTPQRGSGAPRLEVERRWLVVEAPAQALASPWERIEQGYLTVGDGGAETRIRRRDGVCTLTVKTGAGMIRSEVEVELTAGQFEALWPATAGARLVKRRHRLPGAGSVVIELDVYEGSLEGLLLAEVEFASLAEAKAFAPPPWFGVEVSDAPEYRNQRLALAGRPPGAPEAP